MKSKTFFDFELVLLKKTLLGRIFWPKAKVFYCFFALLVTFLIDVLVYRDVSWSSNVTVFGPRVKNEVRDQLLLHSTLSVFER